MRIGMFGTRGVPARYGGFETAVEEVGRRLVERGHHVVVYCRRSADAGDDVGATHHGMDRVELPALRRRSLETLSHTGVSAVHALRRTALDVAFVFNAANVPFLPLIRRRGVAVAVHVDGLESRRAKWGRVGRAYYRAAEAVSVRWADALIADADAIGRYYADEFGASTEMIPYGAPILDGLEHDGLVEFGVEPGRYHLVVARFEPENHVDLIVEGYRSSRASLPLIVVGGAPYAPGHIASIHDASAGDERIRLVGPVWDQRQLDQLYHHAATYLHGHSVGGTNPSLLRAMGAGAAVCAYDVVFTREVLGDTGRFFTDRAELARVIERAERDAAATHQLGRAARQRVATRYRWDDVADGYESLAERLHSGESRRHEVSGRRSKESAW